jgi:small conductance mechanosensitive channel
MMSSPFTRLFDFTILNALHLLEIIVLALLANRLVRAATNALIRPATSQARAAQQREQQTRARATTLYRVSSKIVWVLAVLTALPEFGVNVLPAAGITGLALLGLGFGAHHLVRDAIAGIYIVVEDQFAPGETIQAGDIVGRVEELTLRRTLVRDGRGALVTLANGDLRTVSNLSRDWSQAYVDISVEPEAALDEVLQGLERAAAELRSDAAWSQALIDGPRVLGIQDYGRGTITMRLQLRTAPMRHEEVSRELRRRIQIEFQRRELSEPRRAKKREDS